MVWRRSGGDFTVHGVSTAENFDAITSFLKSTVHVTYEFISHLCTYMSLI